MLIFVIFTIIILPASALDAARLKRTFKNAIFLNPETKQSVDVLHIRAELTNFRSQIQISAHLNPFEKPITYYSLSGLRLLHDEPADPHRLEIKYYRCFQKRFHGLVYDNDQSCQRILRLLDAELVIKKNPHFPKFFRCFDSLVVLSDFGYPQLDPRPGTHPLNFFDWRFKYGDSEYLKFLEFAKIMRKADFRADQLAERLGAEHAPLLPSEWIRMGLKIYSCLKFTSMYDFYPKAALTLRHFVFMRKPLEKRHENIIVFEGLVRQTNLQLKLNTLANFEKQAGSTAPEFDLLDLLFEMLNQLARSFGSEPAGDFMSKFVGVIVQIDLEHAKQLRVDGLRQLFLNEEPLVNGLFEFFGNANKRSQMASRLESLPLLGSLALAESPDQLFKQMILCIAIEQTREEGIRWFKLVMFEVYFERLFEGLRESVASGVKRAYGRLRELVLKSPSHLDLSHLKTQILLLFTNLKHVDQYLEILKKLFVLLSYVGSQSKKLHDSFDSLETDFLHFHRAFVEKLERVRHIDADTLRSHVQGYADILMYQKFFDMKVYYDTNLLI